MKRAILIGMVALLALSGCAEIYPKPTAPVCASPLAQGSIICATATRLNMTPEQIDSAFLDAALLSIGTKLIKAEDLRKAILETKKWVDANEFTIDSLVKYLVKQAEIDPALALLLSRRLGMINLPDLGQVQVTPYDKGLVLAGLNHQLEQLEWF